ncbi:hypothetical protein EW146_g4265 [Bondarzewia mesenterica]|uniref:Alpha/beta hydrolase fold-3 domain-containing protein n=1 Tax=Bondarzewia mesenterica TaxID=1095465 RepID=A0A4S4LWY0_9AGAM|nr:hypothetical protein EW146_g4265 [Bondarzewia mesenterica]
MSSTYQPNPTTPDLSILQPEFRDFIANFPDTIETAQTADVVVKFMRSIPPRPHNDPRITKQDVQVSSPNASLTQPPVNVRIYSPVGVDSARPLPVLLWMHHGGFFSAGPRRLDPFCSAIAADANIVVVAPAYRQTPENPFPAPFDDCYQVLQWLLTSPEIARYAIDNTRLAIGGSSVGGTLAFGLALRERLDRVETGTVHPLIRLLILDDTSFTDAPNTYSTRHNPINKIWNANVTRYSWQLYLPNGADALDPATQAYVVPARATDLTGLPPTLVLCAQWDDLTDDAVAFAGHLLQVGVPTEIHTYRGTFHVSDKLLPNATSSIRKRQDIVNALLATHHMREEYNTTKLQRAAANIQRVRALSRLISENKEGTPAALRGVSKRRAQDPTRTERIRFGAHHGEMKFGVRRDRAALPHAGRHHDREAPGQSYKFQRRPTGERIKNQKHSYQIIGSNTD